jgi:hypothetical protein
MPGKKTIPVAALLLAAAAMLAGCKKTEPTKATTKKDEWEHGKFVPPPPKATEKLKPLPRFTCRIAGALREWRYNPVVSVLADGRVLVAGGRAKKKWLTSSEIFDPTSGRSRRVGAIGQERALHTTVKLKDGRVLVVGGGAAPIELFDPARNAWRVAGRIKQDAVGVAAVQLADGRVYIAGGELTARRQMSQSAYLWAPKTGKPSPLPKLQQGIRGAAFLADDGAVLLLARDSATETKAKLFVTDPQKGTLTPYEPKGLLSKALRELGRSKGGEEVVLAYGSDGKPILPPTGLRGDALLRFFPSRMSWRTLGKLLRDHGAGGAVVALSPDKILVLGGSNAKDAVVEICTPE